MYGGGKLLILIGSSRSGKTTTLRMINRLIEPDLGLIRINDTDIAQFDAGTLRCSNRICRTMDWSVPSRDGRREYWTDYSA